MLRQYTQEQLNKVYQSLPEELQEAIFSLETSEAIWRASEAQRILDERYGEIGRRVGYVLMGLMLPQEFEQALQKDIKLPKGVAQEIAREINRFIFYPVKPALEQLHRMEIEVSAKVVTPSPEEERKERREQPPEEERGPDKYREQLE